jgi:hypothetical protein
MTPYLPQFARPFRTLSDRAPSLRQAAYATISWQEAAILCIIRGVQPLAAPSAHANLQLRLELGGVGVVLGFGLLIVLFHYEFGAAARRRRLTQAAISGNAAAAVFVALVSFGIQQEWFLSGLSVVAAFVVVATRLSGAAGDETNLSKAGALAVD